MLAKWANILPLFVVRWIATRYCERLYWHYENGIRQSLIYALPDCCFKVANKDVK